MDCSRPFPIWCGVPWSWRFRMPARCRRALSRQNRYTAPSIGGSVPIRLSPTPTICRVLSRSRIKLGVGRCGDVAGDAEKGTEGIERIESSVEAEGELVEVGLEMLVADAVMDAGQPGFQVG